MKRMKKKLALIALAAALVFSTGCANSSSEPDWSIDYSPVSYELPSDSISNTENKGEPTFLRCPDGTPVYTSEIASIFTGSDEAGDRREITLEEAERLAREGGDFTVICSGFVYGYLPENAFNRVDDSNMFEDQGDGRNFRYIGEALPPSTEFTRFENGGRIGTLTVKNAYTYFGNANGNIELRDYSDKPGNFIQGGSVEFDGETELSGYVLVAPSDAMYGLACNVTFYPDKKSCFKLPDVSGMWNFKTESFERSPYETFYGFYGYAAPEFGSIEELTVDTGTLKPGDSFVKAAVVIKDIRFEFKPDWGMTYRRFSLNEIRF